MSALMFLGLPNRDYARQQLAGVLRPDDLQRIKWIRVAEQLRGIERGSKLYMLPGMDGVLSLDEHRPLERAIYDRQIQKIDISPAGLAQVLEQERRQ